MSLTQNTPPSEVIYGGPLTYQAAGAATAGWAQVAASSTSAQCLVTGATGASGGTDFTQPVLQPGGGLWHERLVLKIIANGIVSTVVTAGTTATFSFGVTTAPQLALTTGPATGTPITLITSQAYVNAGVAWSSIPWRFDIDLLVRQVGFGTSAVSTAILATGIGGVTPLVVPATGAVPNFGPLPPNVVTTVDTSVYNYVWGAVTFGTNASTSNTCTMLDMIVLGSN